MKRLVVALLIALGILSLVVGAVYMTQNADKLPHFFIGYSKGLAHRHTKHGIAFFALGVVLLLGAWITSGSSSKAKTSQPERPASPPAA